MAKGQKRGNRDIRKMIKLHGSRYAVRVKRNPVPNARVAASPSTEGAVLVLTLPAKNFVTGDAIAVNWTAKTANG